jgi:predicted dehydrogenase
MGYELNTGDELNYVQLFGTEAGVKMTNRLSLYGATDGYLTDTDLTGENGFDFDEAFAREIAHFVDSVQGKTKCINTADDGIALMKILMAVYESAETGHEVIL